jgi:hypothetical protein
MKFKWIVGSSYFVCMMILFLAVNPQVNIDAAGEELGVKAASVPGDVLRNLPPQSWYAAPNSHMRDVCPPRGFGGKDYEFDYYCSSVVGAWSGGAYDTLRNRMIIWGGGHNDYYGNELYAFDVNSLSWERLTDPDLDFELYQDCVETHASGNPVSRHTYGGLAYIAHADRFFAHGGSLACGGGWSGQKSWAFNFDTSTWQERARASTPIGDTLNEYTVYDPESEKVFMFIHGEMFAYDYDQDRWSQLGEDEISWSAFGLAIDTKRNTLVAAGNGSVWIYDLNRQPYQRQYWSTSGGGEIVNAYAPGLEYDPVRDRIVGWAGGDVYSLDVETKQWTRESASGGPEKVVRDTFGRFRYVPEYDVFIAISQVDEDVYFFKPAASGVLPLPGDLNLDRIVNGADVNLAVRVILKLEQDPVLLNSADMNVDGQVNALDLQAIVNVVYGD